MKIYVLTILGFALAQAKPMVNGVSETNSFAQSLAGVVNKCMAGDVSLCLKERALHFAENLSANRELTVVDGITLVGSGVPRSGRSLEPLPSEPRAREDSIENRLYDMFADFLETRTLQFRLPTDVQESIEEGRKKKKKGLKKLMPILSLLKLKFTALIPLFLGILAFVAIKGLLLLKIATLVSAARLVKGLLSKDKGGSSYEVVATPHHEHHEHHEEYPYPASNSGGGSGGGGGGWGRNLGDAQDLAYNGYSAEQR